LAILNQFNDCQNQNEKIAKVKQNKRTAIQVFIAFQRPSPSPHFRYFSNSLSSIGCTDEEEDTTDEVIDTADDADADADADAEDALPVEEPRLSLLLLDFPEDLPAVIPDFKVEAIASTRRVVVFFLPGCWTYKIEYCMRRKKQLIIRTLPSLQLGRR